MALRLLDSAWEKQKAPLPGKGAGPKLVNRFSSGWLPAPGDNKEALNKEDLEPERDRRYYVAALQNRKGTANRRPLERSVRRVLHRVDETTGIAAPGQEDFDAACRKQSISRTLQSKNQMPNRRRGSVSRGPSA
jgi:hypothetical protein